MRWLVTVFVLVGILVLGEFTITGIDTSLYPKVRVKLITDVPKPSKMDVEILEDGMRVKEIPAPRKLEYINPAIDIAFVLDVSGSMEDEIYEMLDKIEDFAEEIDDMGFDYRFSLVTFRDDIVSKHGFTTDTEEFEEWLQDIKVGGGGDKPEIALDAMVEAIKIFSKESSPDREKLLILITDSTYHRKGDGSGLSSTDIGDVRSQLEQMGITVYAVAPDISDYRILVRGFGKLVDINEYVNFSDILDDVLSTIENLVIIEYDSVVDKGEGETVKVDIKATYRGKVMETSGLYVVPLTRKPDADFLYAKGCSYIDLERYSTLAQAEEVASTVALAYAQRRMLEIIGGLKIDSETTIRDQMLESEKVRGIVKNILRYAQVVKAVKKTDENGNPEKVCVIISVSKRQVIDAVTKESSFSIKPINHIIVARGAAFVNKKLKPYTRAVLLARRAAIVLAQRNLLEAVKGVNIDSNTKVGDKFLESDVIVKKVSGVIKGAVIIDEADRHNSTREIYEKGVYWVTMAIPIDEEGIKYLRRLYKVDFGGYTLRETLSDLIGTEGEEETKRVKKPENDALIINALDFEVKFSLKGKNIFLSNGEKIAAGVYVVVVRSEDELVNSTISIRSPLRVKAIKVEGDNIFIKGDREKILRVLAYASQRKKVIVISKTAVYKLVEEVIGETSEER